MFNLGSLSIVKKFKTQKSQSKYPARSSPCRSNIYFNTMGIKHLTRLHFGLTHFCDYKFKDSLLDSLNPICCCRLDIETMCHYFLHCPNFINERTLLLDVLRITNDVVSSFDITSVHLSNSIFMVKFHLTCREIMQY